MSTPLPNSRANRALQTATGIRRVTGVTLSRAGTTMTLEPRAARFTADARRGMRWDGSITVADGELVPANPRDLLAPFGTRVTVELGVELLDGTRSVVPFGRYVVMSTRVNVAADDQVTTLSLIDLADVIERYRFEEPLTVADGTDLAQMINIVVTSRTGTNPNVSSTGRLLGADRTFGLDPETGPWSELLDVLRGFGLTAWYDRVGQVAVGSLTPDANLATALTGVTSLAADFDTRPYNVIVVRGEPPDSDPVQAVAMDDDPGSPTYAGEAAGGSPYGRVTRYYTTPLITTTLQAQDAAGSLLADSIGAGASWTAVRAFDPTVDPLDVYTINGQTVAVDAVTVDVGADTTMYVRSLQ